MSGDPGVRLPTERSFGITFAVIFSLVAAWCVYAGHVKSAWALAAGAAALAAAGLAAPRLLAPLNRAWFRLGMLLHRIVNPIVLGAMFFVVITPMALLLKALRRDALARRYEPDRATYWIEREPPGPEADSFKNQF